LQTVVLSRRTAKEREAVNAEESRVKSLQASLKRSLQNAGKPKVGLAKLTPDGSDTAKFWELDFGGHCTVVHLGTGEMISDYDAPHLWPSSDVAARVMAGAPCRLNLMVYKAGFIKKKPPVKREFSVTQQR
jgi:hypothetical protein